MLALTAWLLAFVVHLPAGKTIDVAIPYINIEVPVSSALVIKLLLVVAGFVSLFTYAISDYTSLFPRHLTMRVFHDLDGIRNALQGLAPHQMPQIIDSAKFQSVQKRYFDKLDQKISKSLKIRNFFGVGHDYITSSGESHTVVEKTKKGLQRYHVTQSEGELTHILSRPGAVCSK